MGDWLHRTKMLWLVGAATLLWNLGVPRLWDRDEPRNAGCAEEMLARNDWVVPVFNNQLRTHKPILLYWSLMLAQQLPLDRETAARLPSALYGLGTIYLTFRIGQRIHSESVGRLAGLILATSQLFVVAARAATPDACLIFFITLALYLFVRGAFRPLPPGVTDSTVALERDWQLTWWQAFGMYTAMACAALAKGPVGIILPLAIVLTFTLLDHHEPFVVPKGRLSKQFGKRILWLLGALRVPFLVKNIALLHPAALLLAVTYVAVPWYLWVGIRTDGVWLQEFFANHNLGRAIRPLEGHSGGLWFYPLAILVGFFPWSVFMVPLTIYNSHLKTLHLRERRMILFLWLWTLLVVGLFSLARTKLPSYVTPTYPALALLMSRFLHVAAIPSRSLLPWMRTSFGVLIAVGVAILIISPVVVPRFLPGEGWFALVGIWPLLIGSMAWWFWSCANRAKFHRVLVAGSTMLSITVFGVVVPQVDQHQQSLKLLQQAELQDRTAPVAAFGVLEPSWVYYTRRSIAFIERDSTEEIAAFLAKPTTAYVLATSSDAATLEQNFPNQVTRIAQVPYFMHQGAVVLLTNRGPQTADASTSSTATPRMQ